MCLFFKCCRYKEPPAPWAEKLPVASRFKIVMDGDAILDRETGLAWERRPDGIHYDWRTAFIKCRFKKIGGRLGWRMPTLEEQLSLLDYDGTRAQLPAGHPFIFESPPFVWVATAAPYNEDHFHLNSIDQGYHVNMSGSPQPIDSDPVGMADFSSWCVRGGFNSTF